MWFQIHSLNLLPFLFLIILSLFSFWGLGKMMGNIYLELPFSSIHLPWNTSSQKEMKFYVTRLKINRK